MIDLEKDTPLEYSQQSRDYQVFRFVYNALFNQIKMYIDLTRNIGTDHIDDKLLASRSYDLNFIPLYEGQNDDLRGATNYFKYILRTKGTKEAILQCLFILSRIKGIDSRVVDVKIENGKVILIVDERIGNENIAEIEDLFRYIFPAGMLYEIVKYARFDSTLKTDIVVDSKFEKKEEYYSKDLYIPDSEHGYKIPRNDSESLEGFYINYETGMIVTDGEE